MTATSTSDERETADAPADSGRAALARRGKRSGDVLKHVFAVGFGLAFAFVLVEVGLRLFLHVTDIPLVEPNPVIGWNRIPGQTGWYIKDTLDPIRAPYRFNQAGFNSPHEYAMKKDPAVVRVAVVGDSFVEALEVPPDASLTAVIEQTMNDRGIKSEAYTFGRSGMGTSQEFFLIRETVLKYQPDAIVVLFIDNDLVDSCAFLAGDPTAAYVDVDEDGRIRYLEPRADFEVNQAKRWASHLAIVRYLYAQRNVEHLWNRLFAGGNDDADPFEGVFPSFYTSPSPLADRAWNVVDAALASIADLCRRHNVAFLLAYGPSHRATRPDRYPPIENAHCDPQFPRRRLADFARRQGIALVDLFDPLVADGKKNGRDHYFMGDGHWNKAGHEVAGITIAERLVHLLTPRQEPDETRVEQP